MSFVQFLVLNFTQGRTNIMSQNHCQWLLLCRIKAADADIGANAEMDYKIVDGGS